jgi:hypothetical protein
MILRAFQLTLKMGSDKTIPKVVHVVRLIRSLEDRRRESIEIPTKSIDHDLVSPALKMTANP